MNLLGFFKKEPTPAAGDTPEKLAADNRQVLAMLDNLKRKVQQSDSGISEEEYIRRLQEEGSGL